MTVRSIVMWPFRQAAGWAGNLWGFVSTVSWRQVLVPSLVAAITWLAAQVPRAFGFGSPSEQITASISLGIAAYISGYVTAFLTWGLIVVFAVTATIGFLRFVPVVEQYWPLRRVGGAF